MIVRGRHENLFVVEFSQPILPVLEQYGQLPIPPYFNREAEEIDTERYQTVFHNPEKLPVLPLLLRACTLTKSY